MSTYVLAANDTLLTDGKPDTMWLHDFSQNPDELHTQALVASGDYFENLACVLERIAVALPPSSVEQYQLQHLIGELLYLERHYAINKKQ